MKTAYLAGSMTLTPDGGKAIRKQIKALFANDGLLIKDPLDMTVFYAAAHKLLMQDILRGLPEPYPTSLRQVVARDLVEEDLAAIRNSDFIIAYISKFSWGTAGEITYARSLGKRIFIWLLDDIEIPFWLLGCASFYSNSLRDVYDAVRYLEL